MLEFDLGGHSASVQQPSNIPSGNTGGGEGAEGGIGRDITVDDVDGVTGGVNQLVVDTVTAEGTSGEERGKKNEAAEVEAETEADDEKELSVFDIWQSKSI